MSTNKIKICFVAHFGYRALVGGESGHIGGVERQTSLMAKWLAAEGHEVSVVVWDEGQPSEIMHDGVRILKVCRQSDGVPGLRFFLPRWTSLSQALTVADADICYHNCAEYVTGQVALWVRINKKKFVYSVASDPACDPEFPTLGTFRERYLYRYGLSTANLVICQTADQQSRLQADFGISAAHLPMPCRSPAVRAAEKSDDRLTKVLWIGRLDRVKRPELLIEIARVNKELEFVIVGPAGSDLSYVDMLVHKSRELGNITWVGGVNFSEVGKYYDQCSVLLCTSSFEGFPNTFLEAWGRGLPVVTTVDPDGIVASNNLGLVANDVRELGLSLTNLLSNADMLGRMSRNARQYFEKNHDIDQAMGRFEKEFHLLLST